MRSAGTIVAAAGVALLAGCVAPSAGERPAASPVAEPPPAPAVPIPPPPERVPAARFGLQEALAQGSMALGRAPSGTARLTLDGRPVALAPDGRFVIAFDRDAAAQALLVAALADGRTLTAPLTVLPRAWRIERLDRVAKVPVPSADFTRRRPAELARIAAARGQATAAQGWRQPFAWPATGRVSGLFGAQRIYRGEPGSYHAGVDVAQPEGAVVVAPADGVVTLAAEAPFTLEGRLLIVDHGHGLNSAFLHLSRIDVREGETVRQGQPIGRVGQTGRASGPHLHWAMTWNGARIDPQQVAGAMR